VFQTQAPVVFGQVEMTVAYTCGTFIKTQVGIAHPKGKNGTFKQISRQLPFLYCCNSFRLQIAPGSTHVRLEHFCDVHRRPSVFSGMCHTVIWDVQYSKIRVKYATRV